MRALSLEDADTLRMIRDVDRCLSESECAAVDALAARGLSAWGPWYEDLNIGGRSADAIITDLGRLALRVAVAIPAVTL